MPLTGKQRSHLRSVAHHLKPLLHVGKEGVTDALAHTVEEAFNSRELMKLKVLDTAPEEPAAIADAIVARLPGAHVVQVIGRTVVVYRPHPEKPQLKLP
jgi:RNA-binding protein